MKKKHDDYLDIEAMKLGYRLMLDDVILQLENGIHPLSIKVVLNDRKTHIENRLEELQ